MEKYYRNTIIEVNLDRILENINEIKEKCAKEKYMYAVIKGDAYGHGIKQIADIVIESKADAIAVATLDEALLVRNYHKDIKILCLGIIPKDKILDACLNNITITIANLDFVKSLIELNLPKQLLVHVKANTGMNRIGFKEESEINEATSLMNDNKQIKIEGLFTHFATAEDYDKQDHLFRSINRFKEMIENIDYKFEQYHCTNSATLLKFHDRLEFTNACRVGIALYGALQDEIQDQYNIEGAFKLKTKIAHIQEYGPGTSLSYSLRYTTSNDKEIIATVPLGYADGFARLHMGSLVRCNDQYGTIVGSICMDQMMIKFDNPVNIDDEVVIIDNDPNISPYKRCKEAQTITHEIFTRFGNRVPKAYLRNNKIVEIDNALLKK